MDFKAIRKNLKWSQMKAAAAIGVSLTTWQLWERGCMKPNEENVKKLQEVFRIESKQ